MISAIAPWFGGKRNLAPRLVDLFGEHNSYWEPFSGGCSILFSKPRCSLEVLNDLHGDIVNLAQIVADPIRSRELYRRVRLLPAGEQVLEKCSRDLIDGVEDPLERAACYLVVSWLGRNGYGGTDKERDPRFAIRWDSGGGSPGVRWQSVVKSIAAWHRRLSGVVISNRDAFDVIRKIKDERGTVIYVDPPYVDAGSAYTHKFDETGFFCSNDHETLSELLERFRLARVVVSYYDVPLVRELYPEHEWRWFDLSTRKVLANTNGVSEQAPEVAIIKGGAA